MTSYNQQSLSRCITCHKCLQQSHAAKRLLPQLEVKLCCHVTVTQWRPILELSASKFSNLSLQAMEQTWVNCKLKTAWHHNSEPGSCAVWVSYREIKLSLQVLRQLSCWLQDFYKFLVISPNYQVVANSYFVPPCGDSWTQGNAKHWNSAPAIPTSSYRQIVIRQWKKWRYF